uniref:Uncharacterized protein n=1 Tax=Amphora coffeiformis TaxID=265554 RepID=A0A7S3L7W0_9STRA|mmetsp:Transcript_25874/g.49021  ORF Transcript_25874/g.49021 Transcript_25874/m.49021 type:complete len:168 (-) Transcript_25874:159-662(-)
MKVVAAIIATATTASAFAPATFGVRSSTAVLAEFDLDYGMKNDYVPASGGDGGQGQFGAVSPSNWRVPGTSPVGQSSYAGAPDGGDEPWFSEAVSTVSLDLAKAEETLKAFTKEAAMFKAETFAKENGGSAEDAMAKLVGEMGYDKFLEASPGQLKKAWEKLSGGSD